MMEEKLCPVCGSKGTLSCSGCRTVHYCSKEHQIADWTNHKLDCSHHLVASKNLKPGKIILQEESLLVAPIPFQFDKSIICVGCCRDLIGPGVRCPNCKWPVCGRKMCWEEGSHHGLGECAFLKEIGDRATEPLSSWSTKRVYHGIFILRCLSLRKRDSIKWKKLLELKYDSLRHPELFSEEDKIAVVKLINQWLPNVTEKELIIKLCGLFLVNSFKLPAMNELQSVELRAVYSLASTFDHSCIANTSKTFTVDGQIVVRAAVPIAKNGKVFLYHLDDPLYGTTKRQFDLLEQTRFTSCCCVRCRDPTELNTFASGMMCFKCRIHNQNGLMLPSNPLDKDSDYVCNKCSFMASVGVVVDFMVRGRREWRDLLCKPSVEKCEKHIASFEKILNPKHYLLTDFKMTMTRLYGLPQDGICLDKKEAIILELLKLADIISPGLTRLRGMLLFDLFTVQGVRNAKVCSDTNCKASEALPLCQEMCKTLEEAHKILSWEPEGTEESRLAKTARKELDDCKSFLSALELEIALSKCTP